MCALSSVARLSVSMTMLMSSGAHRKRLFVDGLVGSASSSGVSCSKRPAITAAGDDDPTSSGPTPPPRPQPHHRHLWKTNPKRAAAAAASTTTGRRAAQQRGGRGPSRIESLPNMSMETPPESTASAASARRKFYGGNDGRRRPQASSLGGGGGVRRHRIQTGGANKFCCLWTSPQASTSIRNIELSPNCFRRELKAFYFRRAHLRNQARAWRSTAIRARENQ